MLKIKALYGLKLPYKIHIGKLQVILYLIEMNQRHTIFYAIHFLG